MNIATTAAKALLDLVAPARCMTCAQEGTWFCRSCRIHLSSFRQQCIVCEKEQQRGSTCLSCRDETPLAGIVSVGPYAHPGLRRGIGWLKFKSIRAIAPVFATLLIPKLPLVAPLPDLAHNAVLIPIPLHIRRQRTRGFNQSEDIAQEISRYTNIPTLPLLVKPKATWAQAKLPRNLRAKNSDNAFSINTSLTFPHKGVYILVDDVATSGTTLNAAASTLLQHIPKTSSIWAATIARG